ncbi:MAG: hypothetical protein AAF499_15140 [Pseudomonadota bacterium]
MKYNDTCHCLHQRHDDIFKIRSLQELQTTDPDGLRYLNAHDVYATLKKLDLSRALVTTVNGDSMCCARPPRICWDTALLGSHPATRCLALQLENAQATSVVYTPPRAPSGNLDMLHFFGASGDLQFRIALNDMSLAFALDALADTAPPRRHIRPVKTDHTVHSLTATIAIKKSWHTGGANWHLAQFQHASGSDRLRALPLLGRDHARRVSPLVVPVWLQHLADMGLAFWRLIVGEISNQAEGSGLTDVVLQGDQLLIQSQLGLSILDLKSVGSCWETRFRDGGCNMTFIELYSRQGSCLAVLAPYRDHRLGYWLNLTTSLPERC